MIVAVHAGAARELCPLPLKSLFDVMLFVLVYYDRTGFVPSSCFVNQLTDLLMLDAFVLCQT